MVFNPDIHRRRSIRLRDYDYARAGAYFVTICTWQRECLFGEVVEGEMRLNDVGQLVQLYWNAIPAYAPNTQLDEFAIMPNHVHGIIMINDPVGAQFIAPDSMAPDNRAKYDNQAEHDNQGAMNRAPTVGEIVRAFKARCTHAINQSRDNPGSPVWQRNYYERVIRDDHELDGIRRYIADNPAKWAEDENHPARV